VENVRAEKLGSVDVMRRAGVRRKDIVKVFDGVAGKVAGYGMRKNNGAEN